MKEHYKGLGHIAIYTADMEQSIAFYENIGGSVFKRDGVQTPDGEKKLALVEFGGFLLELIEPPAGTLVPSGEGSIPHFAVYVDDLDKTAADLKAAGIISFTAPEKKVLPNTFGGLQNWFFTGPSGEFHIDEELEELERLKAAVERKAEEELRHIEQMEKNVIH